MVNTLKRIPKKRKKTKKIKKNMIKKIHFVDQRYREFLVHKYEKGRESYKENQFLNKKKK